jgi:hypothetical protein
MLVSPWGGTGSYLRLMSVVLGLKAPACFLVFRWCGIQAVNVKHIENHLNVTVQWCSLGACRKGRLPQCHPKFKRLMPSSAASKAQAASLGRHGGYCHPCVRTLRPLRKAQPASNSSTQTSWKYFSQRTNSRPVLMSLDGTHVASWSSNKHLEYVGN